LRYGNSNNVCTGVIGTFYLAGPIGTGGLYKYLSGSYVFADYNYYKIVSDSLSHEWSGTAWTIKTKLCS
jgi:hypothetical protein